nr:AlNc14C15G1727 [Albugo laibachii Nc14]|eukprot:CCA15841.1 AlNc14C15G1727 [Albugo laibachii Nc14]
MSPCHSDCVWSHSRSVFTSLPEVETLLYLRDVLERLSANNWLFSSAKYLALKVSVSVGVCLTAKGRDQ